MKHHYSDYYQSVADYYNANHARFLRFGQRGETGAMHRAVWGPGVQNRIETLQFVNHLIAREISEIFHEKLPDIHILDIGCGVGATCMYLAKELGVPCTGVSVSQAQVDEANDRAEIADCGDRCDFLLQDFTVMTDSRRFQCASAVESFVHFEKLRRFFQKCAELLSSEGILIICDDFRSMGIEKNSEAQTYLIRFKKGWRLGNILGIQEIKEFAGNAGFSLEFNRNLSPCLRVPNGIPEHLEKLAYLIPFRTPFLDSRRRSVALRRCYKNGWLEYRFLVFRKF